KRLHNRQSIRPHYLPINADKPGHRWQHTVSTELRAASARSAFFPTPAPTERWPGGAMTDFPCSRERQNCDPVGSFLVIASYPKSAASGPEPVTKHPFRGSQVESCHAIAGIHHGLRISLAGSVHINRQHRRETADILSGNLKSVDNDGIRISDFIPALTFTGCRTA